MTVEGREALDSLLDWLEGVRDRSIPGKDQRTPFLEGADYAWKTVRDEIQRRILHGE